MPDYAPDYTFRYKARYLAAGFQHDMVVRGGIITTGGTTEAGDMAIAVSQFFAPLTEHLATDFSFLAASWAYAGSNVFVPTSALPSNPTGDINFGGKSKRVRATATCMSARGLTGGHARIYFFGYFQADDLSNDIAQDGVVTELEDAFIATSKTVADASFHASDGGGAIWYPRFTMKVNDDLLRLIRRTG